VKKEHIIRMNESDTTGKFYSISISIYPLTAF